ncbi:MAG: UDP-2,4-diacetamido-2,4,6-trideoxy-beta-L-altropyranose hydrolase [Maricaulaceae bacterium]|jgi:UDP-2,4-diacetamido-2,4,6-trideoxy-beta-L-altropyranose hydrolase
MTSRALFRLDAGAAIGLGHAMRCLTLADELGRRGWTCEFAVNPGARQVLGSVAELTWPFTELAAPDDPNGLAEIAGAGCDLLVVDHYGLDAGYEAACRRFADKIVVIDDLADRPHDADLLIDATYARDADDYADLVDEDATRLAGAAYAFLAEGFARARPRALARRGELGGVARVLASLGGAPPAALLDRVASAARRGVPGAHVDVAAGASGPMQADRDPRVKVHRGRVDMIGLGAAADLAVGAGGTASWERCCLGLPTVLVEIADNQREVARALGRAGAAVTAGELRTIDDDVLAALVRETALDGNRLAEISRRAALICDGLGARRVVNAIDALVSERRVLLRPAMRADGEAMLTWQSAPGVRRFAKNPSIPTRTEHFAWLDRRLDDPLAGPFEIIEADGVPAGVVRLDREPRRDEAYKISILVAPNAQGKGVARAALEAAGRLLPDAEIVAEVLAGNAASRKLFVRAGYAQVGPEEFRRSPLAPAHAA